MTTASMRPGRLAILVKAWPRLSETFIAQEVQGLRRRGIDLHIISMRQPTDATVHGLHRDIDAPVLYLPERVKAHPLRLLRALTVLAPRPRFWRALKAMRDDRRAGAPPEWRRRFLQAVVMAAELPRDVAWLHVHFLHTPATVARYAALLAGVPWSFSAHAKDIWLSAEWEKRLKIADARWGVVCTRNGHDHLSALAATADRITLLYHGLDFSRFPAPPDRRPRRDGSDPADPVILLSVGRAVPKKGFDVLLEALARLPNRLAWRWVHIGGGEQLPALKAQCTGLDLDNRVEWLGAMAHEAIADHWRRADLFVLPCRIADDGDRDGLPNVLMEAMIMALPCLATEVAGIPELIRDGETGRLVPQGNVQALCDALAALIAAPDHRFALALAGRGRVRGHFDCNTGIDWLSDRFRRCLSHPAGQCRPAEPAALSPAQAAPE